MTRDPRRQHYTAIGTIINNETPMSPNPLIPAADRVLTISVSNGDTVATLQFLRIAIEATQS